MESQADIAKEIENIEEKLDDLDKVTDEADAEEEKRFKEFEQEFKAESERKMKEMNEKYKTDVDSHVVGLGNRYNSFQKDNYQTKQTDVLRANKIMREVPRALGTDWKEIFERLMTGFPDISVGTQIERFERMPDVVQGYKALAFWRECEGKDFDVRKLLAFLRITGKEEMATEAERVLDSESDQELFKIHSPNTKPAPKTNGASEPSATDGGDDGAAKPRPTLKKSTMVKNATSDGGLLALAKKVGPGWKGVGEALGLSEEAIQEIIESEGDTYQGCFKMFWAWRDLAHEHGQDNVTVLGEALRTAGKTDLADSLS